MYHLRGGILNDLEDIPEAESRWQGECYVFDGRVSVGQGLTPGTATSCAACRRPLTPADRAHPAYEAGAACAASLAECSEADRARFRERHRQMRLDAPAVSVNLTADHCSRLFLFSDFPAGGSGRCPRDAA